MSSTINNNADNDCMLSADKRKLIKNASVSLRPKEQKREDVFTGDPEISSQKRSRNIEILSHECRVANLQARECEHD